MSKPAATDLTAFNIGPNAVTTGKKNAAASGGKWIQPVKRLAIYLRDGMACVYCGATPDALGNRKPATLTLDHLLPQSYGGSNKEGNLVTCCKACNCKRGNMSLADWLDLSCGDDAHRVSALIVEHVALDLKPFKAEAKAVIARRIK